LTIKAAFTHVEMDAEDPATDRRRRDDELSMIKEGAISSAFFSRQAIRNSSPGRESTESTLSRWSSVPAPLAPR
jgi:hypothetical protein